MDECSKSLMILLHSPDLAVLLVNRGECAMPFQRVVNGARAFIAVNSQGLTYGNVLNFVRTGGYDVETLTDLAEALDLWAATELLPFLTTEQDYAGVTVTGMNAQNDLQIVSDTGTGTGAVEAVLFPANVSKAFTLRTGLTGRSARGRWYYPVLNNGQIQGNENLITTTFRDAMVDALEDLRTGMAAIGWTWVVVSRMTGGILRTVAVTFPITEVGVSDLTTDSMRGRLPD